ncbi:MAG: hypothetical protein LLF87_12400 [Eubacteriales bacterium]|nr:hypothetical protein [Eubacteriales bacterium]
MRIEGIGIQKTNAQAATGVSPRLEAGDVLTATVQKAEGDAVVLKTSDGKVFNARLAENAELRQNDKVEFLVAQSGKEGILLRIVYVEPQAEKNTALSAASAAEASILEAFEQAGIKPDARMLVSALVLMRQNGLAPKAALFFALNRMEATPERLAAYQALTSGRGPGETLYEAAQALGGILNGPEPETAHQAQTAEASQLQQTQQTPQTQNGGGAAAPQAEGDAPALQGGTGAPAPDTVRDTAPGTTQPPAQAQGGMAQTVGGHAMQDAAQTTGDQAAQGAARAGDVAPRAAQATGGVQAAQPDARGDGGTTHMVEDLPAPGHNGVMPAGGGPGVPAAPAAHGENAPPVRAELPDPATQNGAVNVPERAVPQARSEAANAPGQAMPQGGAAPDAIPRAAQSESGAARAELKELPSRIFDIFLELTGGEDADDLKKFVSESNAKLEALKFMAEKYDGENMRAVQPRLEQAQAQAKLAQDVTRFVCFELPVHNGEYGTAELYVYRRARGKREIDADNASVLISIPTESFGRVETLLRTENGSLTVTFSVELQGGVDALKENMREFRKSLSASTPYRLGEMRVNPLGERTTVENAEAVLSGDARKNGASIDVKI